MGLYRRGKTYWYAITTNRSRTQRSTGTSNRRKAEKIYAKALNEGEQDKPAMAESKRRTFEELRDRYMSEYAIPNKMQRTIEKDGYSFKRLTEFFGGCTLAEISPQKIADYKKHRREAGIKTATLARELELLRAALNIAVREWEWIEINPFWKVKIEQPKGHKERWLTHDEEEKLIKAAPAWLKDIITFALNTGMRREEIVSLKWPQVDLSRRTVTLIETKNGEIRTLPLNPTACELLTRINRGRNGSEYVFPSETGSKRNGRNVLRAIYSAKVKSGIDHVCVHDLRHTFASRVSQAGIDLYSNSKLMGHKSTKMTTRYAHHNPESLRPAVEALEKTRSEICYISATVAQVEKVKRVTINGQPFDFSLN